MREYLGYRSTLDRLTFVIVELGSVPMELRGRIPRAFTKPGYTCRAIKAQAIRIHLKKRLCASLMSKIGTTTERTYNNTKVTTVLPNTVVTLLNSSANIFLKKFY